MRVRVQTIKTSRPRFQNHSVLDLFLCNGSEIKEAKSKKQKTRTEMARVKSTTVKKCAKVAYTRFDMCVSTLFSPFAGVLYTVSAFEKGPEKPPRPSSRASSTASDRSSVSREV